MINTAPPSGMRDFLPLEVLRRRYVQNTIRRIFELYGFVELETPAVENLTTLLGKYGDEGDQLLFRLLHRRDRLARALEQDTVAEKDLAEMGLRYDLTVPLARVIADNTDLPRFFKRYQMQMVWRADRPGKGRYREFMQCDVDVTGTKSLLADTEVCSAVAHALTELGLKDFTIQLNHRQLLKCLIKAAGIALEQEAVTLVAVDKWDKIGEAGVTQELQNRGITAESAARLLELLKRPDGISEEAELERLRTTLSSVPEAETAIQDLMQVLKLSQHTPAGSRLRVDATLARGLGYYTGPIFEIRSPLAKGSLGGGGRYDGLVGMFSNREIPAVGFSIGFERVVLLMEEAGLFPAVHAGAQILLCRFDDAEPTEVLKAATTLRQANIQVETYPETGKIGKQISYADAQKIPIVGIFGGSETAAQVVSLKHLASGEQARLTYAEAVEKIKEWLRKPTAA